jgi:hypothetical protein
VTHRRHDDRLWLNVQSRALVLFIHVIHAHEAIRSADCEGMSACEDYERIGIKVHVAKCLECDRAYV